jgi:hypothetical protein
MTRGGALSAGAVISDDGRYRYRLWRYWADGGPLLWVMLNPSTADGTADDPTIRTCIGFAKRWGFPGIEVVNLFALRATDPAALLTDLDPIGTLNDCHIDDARNLAVMSVAAWGSHRAARGMTRKVLHYWPGPLMCLGLTKGGDPKHPLYAPYMDRQRLIELTARAA